MSPSIRKLILIVIPTCVFLRLRCANIHCMCIYICSNIALLLCVSCSESTLPLYITQACKTQINYMGQKDVNSNINYGMVNNIILKVMIFI